MNVFEHFSKISEDHKRLPKTFEEDMKIFQLHSNKLISSFGTKHDIRKVIHNFNRGVVKKNMPPMSWMWFVINFMSGVFSVKHSCLYKKKLTID